MGLSMNTTKVENLTRLCSYIIKHRDNSLVEEKSWRRDYLGFGSISQTELNELCDIAEKHLLLEGEGIYNSMGEIIFGKLAGSE